MASPGKSVEKLEPSYIADGDEWCNLFWKQFGSFSES